MALPLYTEKLLGTSNLITVYPHTSTIETNILIHPLKTVNLWGYISSPDGTPKPCAHVELVQVSSHPCQVETTTCYTTFSDDNGYYTFEVNALKKNQYRVLVTLI